MNTDRAEQMRTRVLELIQGWLTNSNAKDNEQCVNLLGALAGDVSIITIPRSCGETAWVSRRADREWFLVEWSFKGKDDWKLVDDPPFLSQEDAQRRCDRKTFDYRIIRVRERAGGQTWVSREDHQCSTATPHPEHTFGGRPMQYCRGVK